MARFRRANRPADFVGAWPRNDAGQHRQLVCASVSGDWRRRLLVALGPPNIHHPGRPTLYTKKAARSRCTTVSWPPLDPDYAALHRWRHRCAARARVDDLIWPFPQHAASSVTAGFGTQIQSWQSTIFSSRSCGSADLSRVLPRRVRGPHRANPKREWRRRHPPSNQTPPHRYAL